MGLIGAKAGFYRGAGGATNNPIYTGSHGIYSTRKVLAEYTGYCMRVRRASDGAVGDVAFDGDQLTGSSIVNVAGSPSLSSWLSATTGTVNIWYDIMENYDLSMATVASQPTVDLSYSPYVGIYWDNDNLKTSAFSSVLAQPFSVLFVLEGFNNAATKSMLSGLTGTYRALHRMNGDGQYLLFCGDSYIRNNEFNYDFQQVTFIADGSNAEIRRDGAELNIGGSGTTCGTVGIDGLNLGQDISGPSNYYKGWMNELIVTQDIANIPNIESDQLTYYGLP